MNDNVKIVALLVVGVTTIFIAGFTGGAIKRIYGPQVCEPESALLTCAQSTEARASQFCMELARNVK